MAFSSNSKASPSEADDVVRMLCARLDIDLIPVPGDLGYAVLKAYETFGKGFHSKAKLNKGDCFAYAMAKRLGATLLYKGDDFAHTDMA